MNYKRTTRRVIDDPLYGTQPIAGIKKATQAASQASKTAAQTGGQYGQEAQDIGSQLVPTLQQDVKNAPGLGKGTTDTMLVAGLEGAGGATSGIVGEEGLRAARTRNVGGSAGVLDEAAREKMRTSSAVGLDVATKDAMAKQAQRAGALKQLEGLYGTDVGAGLKAQSLVPEDIDAWSKANQTGWMQNTAMMMDAMKPGYSKAGGMSFGG